MNLQLPIKIGVLSSTFFLLESPKWSGPRGPQGPQFGPLHFKGPGGPRGPRVNFSLCVCPKALRGCSVNVPIFVSPKDLKVLYVWIQRPARPQSFPFILSIYCIFLIQRALGTRRSQRIYSEVSMAQRAPGARRSPRNCS